MKAPDFAFGSKVCPGLAKTNEEAGEIVQVIGKAVMIGGLGDHYDGTNLKVRLEEEIADFEAGTEFMKRHGVVDRAAIAERTAKKLALFEQWHVEQGAE